MSELKRKTSLAGIEGGPAMPKYEPPRMSSTSEEALLGEMAPIHGVSPDIVENGNEM